MQGLHLLLDPQNYPLLVMCNLGRHRTGTMIGCLRKLQGWNLTSILEEYRRHAGSKFRLLNEQFIELFDCDLVPTSGRWRARLSLHAIVAGRDSSRPIAPLLWMSALEGFATWTSVAKGWTSVSCSCPPSAPQKH